MKMCGELMEIRKNIRPKREYDYGLENALAKHVRTRWPEKTIQHVMHEFGLTEPEASKVVYGHASKAVLNKVLHSKRGGFGLFIELVSEVTGETLESYITKKAEEARNERAKWSAKERALEIMRARVAGDDSLDRFEA